MRSYFVVVQIVIALCAFTSCSINSHIMFETEDSEVITENIPIVPNDAYKISPDDRIRFSLYAENGKKIIDVVSGISDEKNVSGGVSKEIEYLVRGDGSVELPLIGLVSVKGLSVIECEELLEEKYSTNYEDPFVQVEVTNRRVIVFPGSGGEAKVVPINNNNTTLMEAIALAGGISERGKAKAIKVMRLEDGSRKVYLIDLSTLDGLKYADMVVQSNDYIYIEPAKKITREVLREAAPIVSLLSSAIVVFSIFSTL
ncbi:MAG: polysaccharide biosynthesis/export family protein [Brumimicrobium sp.]|nr:polysaccharide biosynthesis/export family protein [Brumimicrobium sp.]